MRFFVFAFAAISATSAASRASHYLPPVTDISQPTKEYIPPVKSKVESTSLSVEGAPPNKTVLLEYLPPVVENKEEAADATVPDLNTVVALAIGEAPVESASEENTVLADDGYLYKTIHRIRYRYRRDVSELPPTKYIPAGAESKQDVVEDAVPEIDVPMLVETVPEATTVFDDDGYHYKTIRLLRHRHRRDASELPVNQYLPPAAVSKEEVLVEADPETVDALEAPVIPEVVPKETTVLADDGYRYQTVRRIKYRHRRGVSELPSISYLPGGAVSKQEDIVADVPEIDIPFLVEATPEAETMLADNGYRYKTVRRLRYRHRRDVNELPLSEYLPPTAESKEEVVVETIPQTLIAPEAPVIAHSTPDDIKITADDGYHYKTVQRVRSSQRHDANALPLNEYLPPAAESKKEDIAEVILKTLAPPEATVVAETAPEENSVLSNDGYHYKTVRRIINRQRRDINKLLSKVYFPPISHAINEVAVVAIHETSVPDKNNILAEDGYRYKSVRRLNHHQPVDVSELPSSKYLPVALDNPSIQAVETIQPPAEESAVLAENEGYRYKVVRRLKYRSH